MRAPGIKSTPEDIAKALEGDYREERLFALKQAVELYDFYHRQVEACDREIERRLHAFEMKVDPALRPLPPQKRKGKKPKGNESLVDLRTELYRISGIDFTQMPGLDSLAVQTILSEIGLDPGKFFTEKHFVFWLGLCPNNRITGGKVKSTNGQAYMDLGSDYYENRYKERVLRNITKRARELGYAVTLQPLDQKVA